MKVLTDKELRDMLKNKEIDLKRYRKEIAKEPKEDPDSTERQVDEIEAIRKLFATSIADQKQTDIQFLSMIIDHRESIVKALGTMGDAMKKEEKPPKKWRFTTKRDKDGRIQQIDAVEIG